MRIPILAYYIGKIYFNLFPIIYIYTLSKGISIAMMFHITGIISIAFLISNLLWWFKEDR